MPRPLTNAEMVALEEDTNYLTEGIPVWGSRVVIWEHPDGTSTTVLIYHTQDIGYVTTDISDLGQSVINQLEQQSDIHGMWYYLPQSMEEIVSEKTEAAIDAAKAAGKVPFDVAQYAAEALGKTINDLLKPLIGSLTVPLVLGVAIGLVYLAKKGA